MVSIGRTRGFRFAGMAVFLRRKNQKTWDDFEEKKDMCYEDFVKDFHVFRPEESFLIAQNKVEKIHDETIDITKINFDKNVYCYDEDVLSFLTGYMHSEYMQYVLEILLEFCGKKKETLVSGYKWLESNYGIDIDSYKYKYYTQRKISGFLYDSIITGNKIAKSIGYQWAKYALAFNFHPTEMGRRNTFLFYNIEITESEGVREYRDKCWKILCMLAKENDWHDKILLILNDYVIGMDENTDPHIVCGDIEAVEDLLTALECENISFLKVIQRLLFNAKKLDVEYDQKWAGKLSGNKWSTYKLFEDNWVYSGIEYEAYIAEREAGIIEYGKHLPKAEIANWICCVNGLLEDTALKDDFYTINRGVELIVKQFEEERLFEFLNAVFQYGNSIRIQSNIILRPLNQTTDSHSLLCKLKESDFAQKNEWLFGFFDTLPDEKVNMEMLEEFLSYLQSDTDKSIDSSGFRNLRILDKFITCEPNIYLVASSIIYKKRNYSSFIVKVYFELLFHEHVYSPSELKSLFQCDLELLQDIYFYMLKIEDSVDYTGKFLQEFLQLGEIWLQKYSEVFWEDARIHREHNYVRNNALWKSDNYIMYYDYLFYHFSKEDWYSWSCRDAFTQILIPPKNDNDNVTKNRQQEWLAHIIIDNVSSERIVLIFEIVCELDEDTRRNAIKIFLDNNSEYERFEQIELVPNHWSGGNSFIPAYQKQIDFLKSLYPYVSEMKYLKHRARIKAKIEGLEKMIKKEEIEVIYRNLYM